MDGILRLQSSNSMTAKSAVCNIIERTKDQYLNWKDGLCKWPGDSRQPRGQEETVQEDGKYEDNRIEIQS